MIFVFPEGVFGKEGRHFRLSQVGEWVLVVSSGFSARDLAKHPTMQKTAP